MNYKKYHFISFLALLIICAYPIYMGISTMIAYIANGHVPVDSVFQYMIPYTPIAIALLISTALMSVIYKLCKKLALPVFTLLAVILFLLAEWRFELIKVGDLELQSWQLAACLQTDPVQMIYANFAFAPNNPAFKIHFYIIAIIIILVITKILFGFYKMFREKNYSKKKPLIALLISSLVFIGLCILACFTAFYRDGSLTVSPISAILMSVFFIVYGITGGLYLECFLYGKKRVLSSLVPALLASCVTLVMYLGELILMDGMLFRFGEGFMFNPMISSFAPIDIIVILASGIATYFITVALNKQKKTA